MTWATAIEKGSRGGLIESRKEFREAVKAWRDATNTHDGPDPKWMGPGMYEFDGAMGDDGRGEIVFHKIEKEVKNA